MKNNIIIVIFISLAVASVGCKKFLTVEPKSSVAEDKMLSSTESFRQALNGVYSQISARSLYGDKLTLGFVSALAQNYAVDWSGAPYNQTHKLNYNSDEVTGHLSDIWLSSYNAIAGLNKIIINAKLKKSVFTEEDYALILGESLGLRALLHFDLVRLFGPEYTTGANQKSIPYQTDVSPQNTPPATTAEVLENIFNDLKEAAVLLKEYDEVTTDTRINRRIRMNYYAVKGLEARVRLYKGDKQGAFEAANEVITSNVFAFVTSAQASADIGSRDRLYVNELVFALRSPDMLSWVDTYFKFNINVAAKLTRSEADIKTLYENSSTDIRYLYRFDDSQGNKFPSKFWQDYTLTTGSGPTTPDRLDQLIPVIRLSEMYYILAETAGTPAEGYDSLNVVRLKRGIDAVSNADITMQSLETEITKEYQKEFYGEGQLFFYYKRKNFTRMQFLDNDIPLSVYELPIPDDELEYNPNY